MNALNPDNLKGKITEDRGCWSWTSNTLATWCKEGTHWKRPWCWERLRAEGEGDDRGWDGWMASPTQWTWVWVDSRSWWWTGKPGVLWFMGSQRVKCNWATELNFDVITLKYLSRLTLWRFLLYFLPGVPSKTRTLWVDFCVWCKRRGQFYSLACCCPVFPALFVKVTILSPLCSPGILVKDLLTTYIWV